MKSLIILIVFSISIGFAQSDTSEVPAQIRRAASVRTLAAEASTLWFYYAGFGGTFDIDFLRLPLATAQGVGIRLNYQEFRKRAVVSFDSHAVPVIFTRSAFLRGSFELDNVRSDALIGISHGDPQGNSSNVELVFGVDVRALIVKPFGSVFGRIMGSPNGISIEFGVSVGYIE